MFFYEIFIKETTVSSAIYFIMKRIFDILISVISLTLLLPLLVLISLSILIFMGQPVFYMQERVGKNGRIFRIIKFRTMIVEADKIGPGISSLNDNRVTSVGKFLRKYKFDELPQFFNVLKGDMSIVGPRPELLKYVQIYKNDYDSLLKIKPGITDFASVEFRNESDYLKDKNNIEVDYINKILPIKISLAKKYLANLNFFVDLKIILSTIRNIVK